MPINQSWLELVQEEPIDPGLSIIDAHHHLWTVSSGPIVARTYDYLPEDYLLDVTKSGHHIVGSVTVECRNVRSTAGPERLWPVSETQWVNDLASHHDRARRGRPDIAAAVVAFADLTLGAAADEVLAAHCAAAPNRLRGVRQISTSSEVPEVVGRSQTCLPHRLLDSRFRRGFACLAPRGLSFDAWLYHPQLPELIDLARAFPETTIVLNHLGAPLGAGRYASIKGEVFAQWQKSIKELATCENVFMKLGGSAMHMFGFGWEDRTVPPSSDELVAATGHFYQAAIDCFSPARCMFESNFPVEKERCSSVVLWNSFKKIAAGMSSDERDDLFLGSATRAYRLDRSAFCGSPRLSAPATGMRTQ